MTNSPERTTQKSGLFAPLFGGAAARAEKARLEAFLSAVPGEYCGWARNGMVAHSPGFPGFLGLDSVRSIMDIQNVLTPADAAALEGAFLNLQDTGQPFTLTVQTVVVRPQDKLRTVRLTGRRGQDALGSEQFDILWIDDISAQAQEKDTLAATRRRAEDERDRLQAALDHTPLPLWMRDSHTNITWCNRAYAQAFDTSPATVIAEQREWPAKPVRKGDRAPGKALAQSALDTNAMALVPAHVILNGRRRLMSISETPLPGMALTLGVACDITREEELETEQKRYVAANKELLEQLGSAIGIFNAEEKLEFYNSAFAQLWGLDDQYLNTGPKLGDIMEKLRETRRLPEQADFRKFKQSWLRMFTSLLQPHEEMLYLPDGSALRMLVVPHPMGGLMMTFEDVTSRLELESSYNTLIAVQKETLDNLAEGVAVFGGDGRIKLWNPAFARLWRLNPEDLEGEPHITRLADRMKGRFLPEEWPHWQKLLVTKSIDRTIHEGRLECSDGTLISYSTVPLPDGGVLATHVDVTDTLKVENALREKNMALEAAERLKLDFLANVSYQLRTPLSAIMGFNEILRNEYFGPLNARQREYTTGMQDASERLLHLVDDILDLSTIEAGYMTLNRDNVSIKDILSSIYNLTVDWARKERIEIKVDCPANVGEIYADERRLKQVLLNLVRNAIAFTPTEGRITLSARREKDTVLLKVVDTGAGISPADQARIFEPFERAANVVGMPSKANRGAGLGLSLVQNIIEMHDGEVLLESVEGKGSAFTLVLPVTEAP